MRRNVFAFVLIFAALGLSFAQKHDKDDDKSNKKKACYTREGREEAERNARVYHEPDPGYDPVLGYDPQTGPRPGSPPLDESGMVKPINCVPNPKEDIGSGTLPKFYCSIEGVMDEDGDLVRFKIRPHFKGQTREKRNGEVNGEFLSSRFSQALGFYAHDSWVADVTCPDCDVSLTKPFQGTKFNPFQPAAGVEVSLGDPIDPDCDGNESADLAKSIKSLSRNRNNQAEIDAFKLWLAFIDHGDTKAANQRFACLSSKKVDGDRVCEPGQSIFFVSDMGSTFGFSSASEKKARLDLWKGEDPIRVSGDRCYSTAKDIGDAEVGEPGRQLLAQNLQRLLDAEAQNGLITRVFKASRNDERDQPAEAWTAEFIRKAKTIINARCL